MQTLLRGYGLILGADRPASGAALLALTLLDPAPGLIGLAAGLAAPRGPVAACNSILLGLLWGWAGWPLPWLALALIGLRLLLPHLTMAWGFLLVAYPAWFLLGPPAAPPLGDHLLTPLGAVVFRPDLPSALVCLLAVALTSRYFAFLLLLGGLTAAAVSSRPEALFNGGLTAVVLGGVFAPPGLATLARALAGAALSGLVASALAWLALPVFVLPLHLVAALAGKRKVLQLETPEARWARYSAPWWRQVPWTLPFWGEWTVCQPPDGGWTHVGPWNEAWDFIVLDSAGRSHRGSGLSLQDYYCYDLPVAAPAAGVVVALVNDVPDNPPGQPNVFANWGNLVVLSHGNGLYTELSHFRQGSLVVELGQRVERGQLLGRCGNSGYSCEPHLHIQLQAEPWPGAPTLPTRFQDYQVERRPVRTGRPEAGQRIRRTA
ncbi:MAG: hypothetical protein AMXMBFR33_41620 [Candidatus Xenobia bacterium]